ncbi:MAG: hydrolase 1, exosortase A system-associated [Colwellia sp.]
MMREQGVIFNSHGKQLIAIEHLPAPIKDTKPSELEPKAVKKGVIIVVGGPQTRVGSHRLFVYLARALAEQGVTVFRFDYSGAGDSEGKVSTFTDIQGDIDAAIQTFQQRHSDIEMIALWGLCDAASAILLYVNEYPQVVKIKKVFLVNPWVRQEHTQAKTYLRSYYMKRFLSKIFWLKLFSGKVPVKAVYRDIQAFHQQSLSANTLNNQVNFVTNMRQGLRKFTGKCHVLLSGNDLTANEFSLLIKNNKSWREITACDSIEVESIRHADHTFSQRGNKNQLIKITCQALVKV